MLIEIERTPNPATRKFLPGRTVMETGGRDFPNADAAEASPLAEALFATGMVDGVYFGRDFISVSAAPTVEWDELEPEVLGLLLDHFMLDAPLFAQGSAAGIEIAPDDADVRGRSRRRRHHRPDQGIDRNPRPPGGGAGRRRHRLSRLQGRHALPRACRAPAPAARRRR